MDKIDKFYTTNKPLYNYNSREFFLRVFRY